MFKFLKRTLSHNENSQTITFTYEVTKETIRSSVNMTNSIAEVLAHEATRFLAQTNADIPMMELKLMTKSRPVTIFISLDEIGSPLAIIRKLKNNYQEVKKNEERLIKENDQLRNNIEKLKKNIGDLVSNDIIKTQLRGSDNSMESNMGRIKLGEDPGELV